MTQPKTPATPYDSAVEARRPIRPGVGVHAFREELARREGYLRALADLAPLHRQMVGALEGVEWVTTDGDDEAHCVSCDMWRSQGHGPTCGLRAALDAARKAGW